VIAGAAALSRPPAKMSAYKTNALGSDYVAGGAYPAEMRSRFLRDLEEHSGRTFVICRQHRIAESTGYKWIKDWEEGGRLEARARGTPPPPARRRRPLAAAARSPPPPARRRRPLAAATRSPNLNPSTIAHCHRRARAAHLRPTTWPGLLSSSPPRR
jgi:transposase-like protein